MIDFRYHVVSIVAVFLALALGLFIGSTTLRPAVAKNLKAQIDSISHKYSQQSADLSAAKRQVGDGNDFDKAVSSDIVRGRLAGETVVVVSAPGADGGTRDGVIAALTEAGATVTGDVRLKDTLLDPQQDQFLTTLADKLKVGRRGGAGGSGSGGSRALAALADVLGERPQGPSVTTAQVNRVISAFSAGALVSVSGAPPRPASLAVLIAAPAPTTPGDPTAAGRSKLLTDFARDLDTAAVGAVVAGPATAADPGGLVQQVRSASALHDSVSTVDSADLPRGQITTVLALAEQLGGGAGSYGSSGADGPVPTPSSSAP